MFFFTIFFIDDVSHDLRGLTSTGPGEESAMPSSGCPRKLVIKTRKMLSLNGIIYKR